MHILFDYIYNYAIPSILCAPSYNVPQSNNNTSNSASLHFVTYNFCFIPLNIFKLLFRHKFHNILLFYLYPTTTFLCQVLISCLLQHELLTLL